MSTRVSDVHVVPVADLIDHEQTWECPCGPDGEFFEESGRWLYVHHSLDGREANEKLRGPHLAESEVKGTLTTELTADQWAAHSEWWA